MYLYKSVNNFCLEIIGTLYICLYICVSLFCIFGESIKIFSLLKFSFAYFVIVFKINLRIFLLRILHSDLCKKYQFIH